MESKSVNLRDAGTKTAELKKEKAKMKYLYSKETKTFKLQKAMMNGEKFTAAEALKRFGIKNIAAEVSRIRQNGYAVYANTRKAGNGVVVREYRLGEASRELVALAYKAKSLGLSVQAA
jgi:hypothetical protein